MEVGKEGGKPFVEVAGAQKRGGHLEPTLKLSPEQVGLLFNALYSTAEGRV